MITDIWRCGPPRAAGRKQGFPARFWTYFKHEYVPDLDQLLHLCSGAQLEGLTVDNDPDAPADIHRDARKLPSYWENKWPIVFCDPPYFVGYSKEWPADYPRPAQLLREMYRVCEPNGIIAMLHVLVVPAPRGLGDKMKRIAIHGILSGPNNVIRALNVFRKSNVP